MEGVTPEFEALQMRLLEMGGLVEAAIHASVGALTARDEHQAQAVLRNEARINQLEMQIDRLALDLLAGPQAKGENLRLLTSAIKINSDLERMGDLAVNIVERALSLIRQPAVKPLIDIPQMAKLAESMVRRSLDAFVRRDPEMAHSVLLSDDAVDDLRDAIYRELVQFMHDDPATISDLRRAQPGAHSGPRHQHCGRRRLPDSGRGRAAPRSERGGEAIEPSPEPARGKTKRAGSRLPRPLR